MDELLNNRLVVAAISALVGCVLSLLGRWFWNKRAIFTYSVRQQRIAASADDAVLGSVRVTWNQAPVNNLYLSTIELKNTSLKDFGDVTVRIGSGHTAILTERTELVGTDRILEWSTQYSTGLEIKAGEKPTDAQRRDYWTRREYSIPVMLRGQVIRCHYLNEADAEGSPLFYVDVVHTGVRLRYRPRPEPLQELLGVPMQQAVQAGCLWCGAVTVAVLSWVSAVWIAAVVCMVSGMAMALPGAVLVRAWWRIRAFFGD